MSEVPLYARPARLLARSKMAEVWRAYRGTSLIRNRTAIGA
jgi:hypothetical protein